MPRSATGPFSVRLHVFGDSHSAYCFDRLEDAEINWLGPWTMHRVARDGLGFIPKADRNDVVVLVFGEIDIRCHLIPIAERSGTTIEEEAADLAAQYIKAAQSIAARTVIVQPPFPSDRRPNQDLPFRGSLEQRVKAHAALSHHLQAKAVAAGILYLPMPKLYATENGTLLRKYSDDGVHIMPVEAAPIADALGKLLGAPVRFRPSPIDIVRRRWNYLFGGSLRRRGLPQTTPMETAR